jgi:hypothetical protein
MQAMQRIGEALQRSQRGGGKASNYKTTSRWLYLGAPQKKAALITQSGLEHGQMESK